MAHLWISKSTLENYLEAADKTTTIVLDALSDRDCIADNLCANVMFEGSSISMFITSDHSIVLIIRSVDEDARPNLSK